MSKNNNLGDFCKDIADAIREKKGTSEPINAQNFAEEIRTIENSGSGSGWTGHADVEGLKAIGWDDEDIAYYQKHGVNWNEEDDEYHKVSDDNKALYGVLTADNIQDYKDRIVYLPKIDFSGVTSMARKFTGCNAMVAMPILDTSLVTNMSYMFSSCYSLTCINPLNTSEVTNMENAFAFCRSLVSVVLSDTSKVTSFYNAFSECRSIVSISLLDLSNCTNIQTTWYGCYALKVIQFKNANRITTVRSTINSCSSLRYISDIDVGAVTNNQTMTSENGSLVTIRLKNINLSYTFDFSPLISKESLLYMIENEAATSAITITLHSYAYSRLAEDADIVEALNNHPLISLASA